jgi:hypothetical protein
MGRDTSINIVNKSYYNTNIKIQELLYDENTNYKLHSQLENFQIEISSFLEEEEVRYWGKSNCTEIVSFMREYKREDGDRRMDIMMLHKMESESLITREEYTRLKKALIDPSRAVVYNTNG